MNPANVYDCLETYSARIEKKLAQYYQKFSDSNLLLEPIRYASLNTGKRIRPALTYATSEMIGLNIDSADDIACAIELIHSYSLIHDDLPSMDDDDFRRGKPSVHKAFGEAIAILAGDAMHATTFELLTNSENLNDSQKVTTIRILSTASGINGMSHGQALDLVLPNNEYDIAMVKQLHRLKTGTLMQACVLVPMACHKPLPKEQQTALKSFGNDIGLCFQICDDILDIESDSQTNKSPQPTYPSLLGLEGAKQELLKYRNLCLEYLDAFNHQADTLRALTQYIASRAL